jgi:hypothetical protein
LIFFGAALVVGWLFFWFIVLFFLLFIKTTFLCNIILSMLYFLGIQNMFFFTMHFFIVKYLYTL